nr:predicted GPI-anchored protein 58 [Aegilops tauschii subsp. strangulata]
MACLPRDASSPSPSPSTTALSPTTRREDPSFPPFPLSPAPFATPRPPLPCARTRHTRRGPLLVAPLEAAPRPSPISVALQRLLVAALTTASATLPRTPRRVEPAHALLAPLPAAAARADPATARSPQRPAAPPPPGARCCGLAGPHARSRLRSCSPLAIAARPCRPLPRPRPRLTTPRLAGASAPNTPTGTHPFG